MDAFYSYRRTVGGALLLSILILSGCTKISPPIAKKYQESVQESSVADSKAAAEKAFDEMEHPDKSIASKENLPKKRKQNQRDKKQRYQDKTAESHTKAPKEVAGDRLDWMDGTSKSYPATRYLTGIGSGVDRRQAKDNARSEIAKIFVSHVNTSTNIEQEYYKEISKGKRRETSQLNIQDMVQVSTQKTLLGVRIAEVYRQVKPKEFFYALAVLDRQQTMTMLTEKINVLDQEIKALMSRASKEPKDLQKLKTLTRVMEKQILRRTKEAEFMVVNPNGNGIVAPIGFEEVKRSLTDILSNDFQIHVAVLGDHSEEITKSLSEGLTREGFVLTNNAKQAGVVVNGNVTINPMDHPDKKWKYVRWRTVFELMDQNNQTVFGTLTNSGREGHLNSKQAVSRATMKIQKELLPKVSKEIQGYIFGQSSNR
jgi:hypothetical protein